MSNYKEGLTRLLRNNPNMLVEYLNVSLEDNDLGLFFRAMRDAVDSEVGMTEMAELLGVNRTSLYKSFDNEGNPRFKTIYLALKELGLKITIERIDN